MSCWSFQFDGLTNVLSVPSALGEVNLCLTLSAITPTLSARSFGTLVGTSMPARCRRWPTCCSHARLTYQNCKEDRSLWPQQGHGTASQVGAAEPTTRRNTVCRRTCR